MKTKKVAKASIFGLELLKFLSDGTEYFSLKELHKSFNPTVDYKRLSKSLNNLNKQGLLDIETRNLGWKSNINSNGLNYLKDVPRSIREPTLPCRTHDLVFNMDIKRRGQQSFKGFRVATKPMQNWKFPQLTKENANGIIFQTTDKTLKIRFLNVYGHDSNDAIFTAFERLLIERDKLMREDPELILGGPRKISSVVKQHHALNIPEFSTFLEEIYVHWKDDRIEVDKSKGYPELEFVHSSKSQEDWSEFIEFIKAVIDGRFKWRDFCDRPRI